MVSESRLCGPSRAHAVDGRRTHPPRLPRALQPQPHLRHLYSSYQEPPRLHPLDGPLFESKVERVRPLVPEGLPHDAAAEASIFELVLDLRGSRFVSPSGVPLLAPGHHIHVPAEDFVSPLPDEREWRRYSIADLSPDGRVTLVIRRVDWEKGDGKRARGPVSNELARLSRGQKLRIAGASTHRFLMPPDRHLEMAFVGSGAVTMRAPGEIALNARFEAGLDGLAATRFWFGVAHLNEALNTEELAAVAAATDSFRYGVAESRGEDRKWVTDIIDTRWILEGLVNDRLVVYMCGLDELQRGVLDKLRAHVTSGEMSAVELDAVIARAKVPPETLERLQWDAGRQDKPLSVVHREIAESEDCDNHRWRPEGRRSLIEPTPPSPGG